MTEGRHLRCPHSVKPNKESVCFSEPDGTRKEKVNKAFLIKRFFVRMKLISSKCLLKPLHINYLVPDSFTTTFIPQLAVFLWMAGGKSHKRFSEKRKSHNCMQFIELALWSLVSRPPHPPGDSPVTWESRSEAWVTAGALQIGRCCRQGWPATGPPFKLPREECLLRRQEVETEVRRGLGGTDGWTVRGQGFLWKAIQRILWQRLCQLITSPLTLSPAV